MRFALIEQMRSVLLFLALLLPAVAQARIGETAIQFADRYGAPKDTSSTAITDRNSPLIQGATHHTYDFQGWKIRAAFLRLDGPAVRMDYSKIPGGGSSVQIQDYELQAIVTANTPAGTSWKEIMYNNPDVTSNAVTRLVQAYFADAIGEKMWQRSDGTRLWLRSHLSIRLELPAAHQYEEELKISKEQKARASVPQF